MNMENVIKLETNHPQHTLEIAVDNSTEFKDFGISLSRAGRIHSLNIKRHMDEGVEVLEMGSVKLRGREVELLREFLNQKP